MYIKILKTIKDAAFPDSFTCDVCGTETFGYNLCENCLKNFELNDGNTCPLCGRKAVGPELCYECKSLTPLFKKAVSPLVYTGNAQTLIKKFKLNCGYLKEFFADLIYPKLKNLPECDCIVYVPLSSSSKRKRGYNQTLLLAKSLGSRTGIPVIKRVVKKVKTTKPQKNLSLKERKLNLEGCFKVVKRKEIYGKRILLVDDVITTGATADEITKTLLKASAKYVCLATVASVPVNLPFNTKY